MMLPRHSGLSAQSIDGAVLGGGHQPRARIAGNALGRPLLERGHERILGQVFGETEIAHDAGEAGDEPRRFDTPDRVDRLMGFGSRHGYRSHHLRSRAGKPRAGRIAIG